MPSLTSTSNGSRAPSAAQLMQCICQTPVARGSHWSEKRFGHPMRIPEVRRCTLHSAISIPSCPASPFSRFWEGFPLQHEPISERLSLPEFVPFFALFGWTILWQVTNHAPWAIHSESEGCQVLHPTAPSSPFGCQEKFEWVSVGTA